MKRPSFQKTRELYEKVSAYTQDGEKQLENEMRVQWVQARFLNLRVIVPLFLLAVALLAAVSTVIVLRERAETTQPTEMSETQPVDEGVPPPLQGNFLLALTDGENGTLRMLAVLRVNSETGGLSVFYVPPHTQVLVNNTDSSLQRHYALGGATELSWAVAQAMNTEIYRYIIVTDSGLQQIVRLMDARPLTVDEDIDYESDGITYKIEKGEQTLSSDVLCKYMDYRCDALYRGGDAAVTEMLSYFATALLCDVSAADLPQRLTQLFRNVTSNVTAMDLIDYAALASHFTAETDVLQVENEGVREAQEAS